MHLVVNEDFPAIKALLEMAHRMSERNILRKIYGLSFIANSEYRS